MAPPVRPEPDLTPEDFAEWRAFQAWKASRVGGSTAGTGEPASAPEHPRGYRTPAQIARLNKADIDAAAEPAPEPGVGEQLLGAAASLGRDIPGVEAAQTGLRSLVRGAGRVMPGPGGVPLPVLPDYKEQLAEIRAGELKAPKAARLLARGAGGILAAAAMPGASAVRQGAALGAASGALAAEPKSLGERTARTALGAGLGAGAGKVAEVGGTVLRALAPRRLGGVKNLGEQALERADAIKAADEALSGPSFVTAKAEAQAVGTTPAIRRVLDSETVKPYADKLRATEGYGELSDAELLLEVRKLMSQVTGKAVRRAEGSPDFLADVELQRRAAGRAHERILKAAEAPIGRTRDAKSFAEVLDAWKSGRGPSPLTAEGPRTAIPVEDAGPAIPSLRPAVRQHAKLKGEEEAFQRGADMAQKIAKGTDVAGRKLVKQSAPTFRREIAAMTPEEAKAALEGVLGRVKEIPEFGSNPLTLFNVVPSAARLTLGGSRLAPYVRALDKQAGTGTFQRLLESFATGTLAPRSNLR